MSSVTKGNLCYHCVRAKKAVLFFWIALALITAGILILCSGCGADVHRIPSL